MRNPLSIEEFADWCAKKPADARYCYSASFHCACAQYAESMGLSRLTWRDAFYAGSPFWKAADDAASYAPHTFQDLAQRLRSAS